MLFCCVAQQNGWDKVRGYGTMCAVYNMPIKFRCSSFKSCGGSSLSYSERVLSASQLRFWLLEFSYYALRNQGCIEGPMSGCPG